MHGWGETTIRTNETHRDPKRRRGRRKIGVGPTFSSWPRRSRAMSLFMDGNKTLGSAIFGHAKLGDQRRTSRLVKTFDLLCRHPGGTLPDKLVTPRLEGVVSTDESPGGDTRILAGVVACVHVPKHRRPQRNRAVASRRDRTPRAFRGSETCANIPAIFCNVNSTIGHPP